MMRGYTGHSSCVTRACDHTVHIRPLDYHTPRDRHEILGPKHMVIYGVGILLHPSFSVAATPLLSC